MVALDWVILGVYVIVIVGISYLVGRRQENQEDYYVGGRRVPSWQVGGSLIANQVSAISLVGAPAFIAVKEGGGLKWLQYELAIPLAMIVIMAVLVPSFRSMEGITIYQWIEYRFGTLARAMLSLVFLVSRSLATGVALLATSYVTSKCIDLPLDVTIIGIALIALLYTALGGIRADIYSDIIQLVILWIASIVSIVIIFLLLDGDLSMPAGAGERLVVFHTSATGLGDGETFSVWPMLLGGFFLYISYYGCDQSQAQRLLATPNERIAQKALLLNGIFRFPLVLTYCAVGLLLIPLLDKMPFFAGEVMQHPPDYLVPIFFRQYMPAGMLGFIVSGVFAASMSSLDSAINSLSASTWNDMLLKVFPGMDAYSDRTKIRLSRLITIFWGVVTTWFALYMAGGTDTVIELVNMIGSAFYGPIAALFIVGMLLRAPGQGEAVLALVAGVMVNVYLWKWQPGVSWMWWNLSGFATAAIVLAAAGIMRQMFNVNVRHGTYISVKSRAPVSYVAVLAAWFFVMLAVCMVIEGLLLTP